MNRIITIALLLISIQVLNSQELWTLDKCLSYASEHNLNIKTQRYNEQIAKQDYTQSYFEILPNIDGAAQHVYNIGKRIDPYTNEFAENKVLSQNFYVSGSFNIFSGFRTINTIKKRKLDLQANQYTKEKVENDISLEITSSYLQILYNKELLRINEAQLSTSKEQVNKTQIQVEGGKLAKRDLLDIQAQEAREEANFVRAQNALEISYLNLTNLLELDSVSNFEIAEPQLDGVDQSNISYSSIEVYNKALDSRPEIKSAEIFVKSAEKTLDIQRGARMPSLALQGYIATGYSGASQSLVGYDTLTAIVGQTVEPNPVFVQTEYLSANYEDMSFSDQIDANINRSYGFYLRIPIFNNWRTQTSINKSKIEIYKAKTNLEQQKNLLHQTISQAHTDALASYKEYIASDKSLRASEEAFKYTEQKFNLGAASSVEYNEAKNNLNRANAELLQAKYNFIFKTKILDFYLDKPLGF